MNRSYIMFFSNNCYVVSSCMIPSFKKNIIDNLSTMCEKEMIYKGYENMPFERICSLMNHSYCNFK